MNKKAWAAKKIRGPRWRQRAKEELLRRAQGPRGGCAYVDCTESQMMAMFGWIDPKMPAHGIAQANREKLAFDQPVTR
jgi:hypothetical protein